MGYQIWFIIISFAWLIGCSSTPSKRILVIHSYEESFKSYREYDKVLKKSFKEQNINADIHTYYLNCESLNAQDEIDSLYSFMEQIAKWKPDIILVNEDQATYSLLAGRHPLLKKTPIVFAGVNYPNWGLLKEYPNVTGLHDKIDIVKNIDMIKDITKQKIIFTLLDYTFLDRKIRADIKEQTQNSNICPMWDTHFTKEEQSIKLTEGYTFFRAYQIRSNNDTTTQQNYLNSRFLWSISKYKADAYLQLKCDFTTTTIGSFAMFNRFTAIYEMFNSGYYFLGGYLTLVSTQAKEEAALAAKILRGAKPEDIPVQESFKDYYLDWNVMKLEHISPQNISSKYKIINLPFREQYPIMWWCLIIGIASMLTALVIWLTFLYLREQRMRRQVLYDLEDEKESLALAIEGGKTFSWRLKQNQLLFKDSFWEKINKVGQPLNLEEFIAFVHPDHHALFYQNWERIKHTQTYSIEILCDFTGNGYQWWEFRSSSVDSIFGQLKTTGLLLNIEDFKKREEELIEARELAEKAELKQSFLANMSHEIRTPLNAIIGFSNILVSEDYELEKEERKMYIETINNNSELLLKLINDILEISRIESGYMSFDFQHCPVSTLLEEIYTTHSVIIPSHLDFQKEICNEPLQIYIDKSRLTQVLTNFLNNACKFTPRGYVKLGSKYYPEKKQVHLFVEDSGKGIPKAEQKMIFSRFYKQDEFAQGAGLGLSICQVIIGKLNGQIELRSEPGIGSRFTIILECEPMPG